MLNVVLFLAGNPAAVARSRYVPTLSIRQLTNVATPAPAVVTVVPGTSHVSTPPLGFPPRMAMFATAPLTSPPPLVAWT